MHHVVLGAFGCGAFRNPATQVAHCFCDELLSLPFKGAFATAIFAVADLKPTDANADEFQQVVQTRLCRAEEAAEPESETAAAVIEGHLVQAHGWSPTDGDPVSVDSLSKELISQHKLNCNQIVAGMLKLQYTRLGFVDRRGSLLSAAQVAADGGTRVLIRDSTVYEGFAPIQL